MVTTALKVLFAEALEAFKTFSLHLSSELTMVSRLQYIKAHEASGTRCMTQEGDRKETGSAVGRALSRAHAVLLLGLSECPKHSHQRWASEMVPVEPKARAGNVRNKLDFGHTGELESLSVVKSDILTHKITAQCRLP